MKVSRKLLIRFSKDECTQEEALVVEQWLNDGSWPELPQEEEISEEIKQAVWARIRERMQTAVLSPKPHRWKFLKIAAVIAALVITGFFIYTFQETDPQGLTFVTRPHEHNRIVLPDNSVVFLAPRSTITLAEDFDEGNRRLSLRGKATFEVVSDERHPFIVVSGNITTTALGTSFQVNAYPKRRKINVILSYGKVQITDSKAQQGEQPMYLQPGEEAVFDKTSLTIKKVMAQPKRFSYKNHILYFKNAGLREVVKKLERYYQVTIDSSRLGPVNWKVSGEFKYQPLDVVLKAIAYSCNIAYEIKDDRIILEQNKK